MPKLTQLVGGVSEDGEDWWLWKSGRMAQKYHPMLFSKHQRKSSETIEKFGYESYNLKISYGY